MMNGQKNIKLDQ